MVFPCGFVLSGLRRFSKMLAGFAGRVSVSAAAPDIFWLRQGTYEHMAFG